MKIFHLIFIKPDIQAPWQFPIWIVPKKLTHLASARGVILILRHFRVF